MVQAIQAGPLDLEVPYLHIPLYLPGFQAVQVDLVGLVLQLCHQALVGQVDLWVLVSLGFHQIQGFLFHPSCPLGQAHQALLSCLEHLVFQSWQLCQACLSYHVCHVVQQDLQVQWGLEGQQVLEQFEHLF